MTLDIDFIPEGYEFDDKGNGGYPISDATKEELDKRFTYHAPKVGHPNRYTFLRKEARKLAMNIIKQTPVSREQSIALTKLEEAIMWANAAIARNE